MNLESLANELLIDIFEFLSCAHLLHAFHGLNARFDSLLLDHFRTHGLDFRSILKHDFNVICRHLYVIANQITSLYLSEKDDTPGQIDQFYSRGLTLRQFTRLQSLSLYHLHSQDTMNKILLDLPYLSNITHLTFEECCFAYDDMNALTFITIIWSLPKLTHCYMKIQFKPQIYFPIPTVISSTIEHLSIRDIEPKFNEMSRLLEKIPNLRHISIDFHFNFSAGCQSSIMTSIITLNVSFFSIEYHILVKFFKILPSLRQLKVDLPNMYIDGKTWEQIIGTYLPKLRRFQFRMNDEIDNDSDLEQQIDEILNSFRSQFWLDKYQLCVRCDWNPHSNNIFLYSLPYAFDNFYFQSPIVSKSSCHDDNQQWSYNYVRRLTCKANLSEWLTLSHIQFNKIRELCVYLPINEYFWSIIPRLERLTLLDVLSNDDNENCDIQLQTLLDRVPHLFLLRLRNWSSMITQILPVRKNTLSISQLDLMWYKSYNYDECFILGRLLLDIQCKMLSIYVTDRTCILELVNTMTNLQALNIRCQEDQSKNSLISMEDELIKWLEQYLPSSLKITRDYYPVCCIRLWIR
ncbi:unnamed protein product [Rotaria sp. Silwood2]|nr:unnamed protein product [Rotaria sp. Silwood2]CAF2841075.1 unnamed protein product [Rotaria sp. Silwood2]CAF3014516.1 unnamed protein product [Rotaria sp. Silwood2]CAF3156365.1 unnamed protein product [Rotaria sp. Silwood2]CAF4200697.1 unnamed protein product [Rotaria sp. Silwood2]